MLSCSLRRDDVYIIVTPSEDRHQVDMRRTDNGSALGRTAFTEAVMSCNGACSSSPAVFGALKSTAIMILNLVLNLYNKCTWYASF